MSLNLEHLDAHIRNLQSQLSFLAEALDATEPSDPQWLPTDLITLKGKTSMLVDDMRMVRKRVASEHLRTGKATNKRLSIEGGKPPGGADGNSTETGQLTPPAKSQQDQPPPVDKVPDPTPADDYQVQYIDVSEEVDRRLRESRLRRLMDSPSTSQKRKYDALEDSGGGGGEENMEERGGESDIFETFRSPTKKVKAFGSFNQMVKLKEGVKRVGNREAEDDGGRVDREDFKRRKI